MSLKMDGGQRKKERLTATHRPPPVEKVKGRSDSQGNQGLALRRGFQSVVGLWDWLGEYLGKRYRDER